MPRPLTYAEPEYRRLARAGAHSLDRIEDDGREEWRYQKQATRQAAGDARAVESHNLEMEVRRYHHAKEKALDENAWRLKMDLVKEATEANQGLRDIRTDAPDAVQQLSDWRVKHFRLLDPEIGDARLIKQFGVNQRFINQLQLERERDARERAVRVEREQAAREKAGAGKAARKGEGKEKGPTAKPVEQAVAPVVDEEAVAVKEREAAANPALEVAPVVPAVPMAGELVVAPAAEVAKAEGLSERDRAALEWARANSSDPRAMAIIKKHEGK